MTIEAAQLIRRIRSHKWTSDYKTAVFDIEALLGQAKINRQIREDAIYVRAEKLTKRLHAMKTGAQ